MDSGATATSQPAGLGSYRKPGCTTEQTVHTHTVCIYLFTWLETILLESRRTLTSACCCTPYLPNAGLTGTDHHTLLKIQFVSLQNQSLDKMENFPCHSKNNQQEEMKRVAWPWNQPSTRTPTKACRKRGLGLCLCKLLPWLSQLSKLESGVVLFRFLFLDVRLHIIKSFSNRIRTKRRINILLSTPGTGSPVFLLQVLLLLQRTQTTKWAKI